jgi:hypothetical protein
MLLCASRLKPTCGFETRLAGPAHQEGVILKFKSASRAIGLALLLCGCFAATGSAQNAPAAAPSTEPAPKAEAGTTAQSACIAENDGWVREGRGVGFAIELTNKCEQRLKCRVFAYVTSAKGAAQGNGTLVLAPASKGPAATKHWSMTVKMSGGSGQTARECRMY